MNTAALAAASDPDCNVQFHRRWTGPPPVQRERPALAATSNRVELFSDDNSIVITKAGGAAARACEAATRRIANSQSGCFAADIKTYSGIERVYSHNGGDPLRRGNPPTWCGVTALDAIDTTIILDYGGDWKKVLRDLAERFGLANTAERKAIAALVFRMVEQQVTQQEIESTAFAEGERLGLSRDEVCSVVVWCTKKFMDAA